MKNNMYKGYHLFSDVEDYSLRNRNRGVVMANIFEDNLIKGTSNISNQGALLLFGYMQNVPEIERSVVTKEFTEAMKKRGYVHAS